MYYNYNYNYNKNNNNNVQQHAITTIIILKRENKDVNNNDEDEEMQNNNNKEEEEEEEEEEEQEEEEEEEEEKEEKEEESVRNNDNNSDNEDNYSEALSDVDGVQVTVAEIHYQLEQSGIMDEVIRIIMNINIFMLLLATQAMLITFLKTMKSHVFLIVVDIYLIKNIDILMYVDYLRSV